MCANIKWGSRNTKQKLKKGFAARWRRQLLARMFRIDQPHLCWVLENLMEGKVVNQIKVDGGTQVVAGGVGSHAENQTRGQGGGGCEHGGLIRLCSTLNSQRPTFNEKPLCIYLNVER
jgi:hypothetical protein